MYINFLIKFKLLKNQELLQIKNENKDIFINFVNILIDKCKIQYNYL
jgi:hypothetical protein